MKNALSFDVEDWRQIVHWKMTGERIRPAREVLEETDYILEVLAEHGVRGTFFILANIAGAYPELVRRIGEAGHEIGSHGYSHTLVYRQTPDEFREETRRAKEELEALTGAPVRGYRAAEFSVTRKSWWALEVLAELGFAYDSSVYPIPGTRYGVPDAPLVPHTVHTPAGPITEVPLTAVEWRGRRWPVGGGGYFRLFPYAVTRGALREVNRQGRAGVVYLHPYEFAARPLRLPLVKASLAGYRMLLRNSIVHNISRGRVRARFTKLLQEFQFHPIEEVIANVG